MFKLLFQPYPLEKSTKKVLISNASFGIFVAVFLLVFQPFQIEQWITDYKILKITGYGVLTFLVTTIFHFLFKFIFSIEKMEKNWTVGKEISLLVLFVTTIALANTIYSNILGIVHLSIDNFIKFIPVVVCIGIFPIVFTVLLKYNQYRDLNIKNAAILDEEVKRYIGKTLIENPVPKKSKLVFTAENEKDTLEINADNLWYLESLDNYSKVVFEEDNSIKNMILRGSLKRFESQISSPYIQRCHRSFIVNLQKVQHIKGNAQGYKVIFENETVEIPVSRNYGQSILAVIGDKKK